MGKRLKREKGEKSNIIVLNDGVGGKVE